MRVTAVVVNWNGAGQLPGCLKALDAQDHPDLEIVVVDNASTDGSRDWLARWAERPLGTVVWNTVNRGFAGGVNDGLAVATGEAVLVANFDVRPRPDFARRALEALLADPRRGAVQGKLLRPVASPAGEPVIDTTGHRAFSTRLFRNRGEGEVDRGQYEEAGEVFGVSGALALYRRAMLKDVAIAGEVLDEDMFAYFEDVDLDWRARMRGWVAWYEPAAVAVHERGGAGPRRTRRVEQLNFRNRLLTLVKCDTGGALAQDLPGVVLTTALKAAELLATHPLALAGALGGVRLVLATWRRRRVVHRRALVESRAVVDRWFEPFDYREWVRTWWHRVRGRPPGRPPAGW